MHTAWRGSAGVTSRRAFIPVWRLLSPAVSCHCLGAHTAAHRSAAAGQPQTNSCNGRDTQKIGLAATWEPAGGSCLRNSGMECTLWHTVTACAHVVCGCPRGVWLPRAASDTSHRLHSLCLSSSWRGSSVACHPPVLEWQLYGVEYGLLHVLQATNITPGDVGDLTAHTQTFQQ